METQKELGLDRELRELEAVIEHIQRVAETGVNMLKGAERFFVGPVDAIADTTGPTDLLHGAWGAAEWVDFDRVLNIDDLGELDELTEKALIEYDLADENGEFTIIARNNDLLNERINADVLERLDPANSRVEEYLNGLPADMAPFTGPARVGIKLLRMRTAAPNHRLKYKIDRADLDRYVSYTAPDGINDRVRIERGDRGFFTVKLEPFISSRTQRLLPWAVGNGLYGMIAAPPLYERVFFNVQDGYYNVSKLRTPTKNIHTWMKTVEGKMMMAVTRKRFAYKGADIHPVYRINERAVADEHSVSRLYDESLRDAQGVYVHPTVIRHFVEYLGEGVSGYVMPCVRFLRLNPYRFVDGSSWYSYPLGVTKPCFRSLRAPHSKRLIFWIHPSSTSVMKYSYGDIAYIRGVLGRADVYIVAEFFGVYEDELSQVEDIIKEFRGERTRLKTYTFPSFRYIKAAAAAVFINVDRAYYDHDKIRLEAKEKIVEGVVYNRERLYFNAPTRFHMPRVIGKAKVFEDDEIIGDLQDYIDTRPNHSREIEILHDLDPELDEACWAAKEVRFVDEADLYLPETCGTVRVRDCISSFNAVEAVKLSDSPDSPIPSGCSSAAEMSGCSVGADSVAASTGSFFSPLIVRRRRQRLLRVLIIGKFVETYHREKITGIAEYKDPNKSRAERLRLEVLYEEKYSEAGERKFQNTIRKLYNNVAIPEVKISQVSVPENAIDIIDLDGEMRKLDAAFAIEDAAEEAERVYAAGAATRAAERELRQAANRRAIEAKRLRR